MRLSLAAVLLLAGKAVAQTANENLVAAILADNAANMRTALNAGADPNVLVPVSFPDPFGGGTIDVDVPAIAAVTSKAAIDELLAETDLNVNVVIDGTTALFQHMTNGRRDMVQSMLAATVPTVPLDKTAIIGGDKAFHMFARMDEDGVSTDPGGGPSISVTAVPQTVAAGMMDDLIGATGFDVDAVDAAGATAIFTLMTATDDTRSSANRAVLIGKLAAAGADVTTITGGFDSRVALDFACSSSCDGPEFAVALFQSPGVDIDDTLPALNNETCLIAVIRDINVGLNEDSVLPIVQSLLSAGADPSARAIGSLDTALHLAAVTQSAAAVLALTAEGARDNLPNVNGDLALHLLANSNPGDTDACSRVVAVAQALIEEAESDISAVNGEGKTPRQVAATFATDGGCANLQALLEGLTVTPPNKPSGAGKSAVAVAAAAATLALSLF